MKVKVFPHKIAFLFLLPLFFIFHGYVEHYPFIQPDKTVLLLVFYVAIILMVYFISAKLLASDVKGALFTFLIFSINFFFGSLHDTLKLNFPNAIIASYTFLLLVVCFLPIAGFIFFKKKKIINASFINYLNLTLTVLILIDSATLFSKGFSPTLTKEKSPLALAKCDSCAKSNIYLIVADEYPGQRALAEVFQYDNNQFEQALRNRGFFVIQNTKSNYNYTPFSIASILNFDYLPLKDTTHTQQYLSATMDAIKENRLTSFLRLNGYTIVNNSVFELKEAPPSSSSSFLPTQTEFIYGQTLLSRIERDLSFHLVTKLKLNWAFEKAVYNNKNTNEHLYNKTLETVQSAKKPTFSYTHLTMPHHPYYFKENGELNEFEALIPVKKERNMYLSYLKYCNRKILELIDVIKKNSGTPPVIILMSDHGFMADDQNIEKEKRYNFINFCSIYLPDGNYQPYYKGLSTVNFLRIFLNTQFHQRLPLLKDSTIAVTL